MSCTPCRLGRPWECESNGNCVSNGNATSSESSDLSQSEKNQGESSGDSEESASERQESTISRTVNTYKTDASLKDQQSTGRKRAAVMYPLDRDADCEWKFKKNCGGGDEPIVGCADGKQQARHHGPDKNTLNNDEGNVHRICHSCHNNWHAANDEGYVWGGVYKLHIPVEANKDEIVLEQFRRMSSKVKQVVD